jgi:2-keto-4-pentenoate hydratase/2-oxohepta-3-ene-1,7-dioic acid hydratase in catechol pathway
MFLPHVALASITQSTVSFFAYGKFIFIVKEGGRPVPPLPTVFFKGSSSIAGHGDVVEIPKICQDDQADYEGELVVVIGKDAKNVSRENALDYVLGYTAGDDVSSR